MGNKITFALILITLGIMFYFSFAKQDIKVQESLSVNAKTTNILGKKLAAALNQIETLTLDTEVIKEEGYLRLKESKEKIPVLSKGRDNPFLPFKYELGGNEEVSEEVFGDKEEDSVVVGKRGDDDVNKESDTLVEEEVNQQEE